MQFSMHLLMFRLTSNYYIDFSVYMSLMKFSMLWLRMRSYSTENLMNDMYTLKSVS